MKKLFALLFIFSILFSISCSDMANEVSDPAGIHGGPTDSTGIWDTGKWDEATWGD